MPALLESMAWTKHEKPWHGLGTPIEIGLSIEEMQKAAGLDWTLSKEATQTISGIPIPGKFALIRSSNDDPSKKTYIDTVGKNYQPVQPIEALSFFNQFLELGDCHLETAGSLKSGQYIWGLARMGMEWELPGGDVVQNHILINSPNLEGKSLQILVTPIRVVCWNTLTMAVRGAENMFRMCHGSRFDATMQDKALKELGLAASIAAKVEEQARFLAAKPCDEAQAEAYWKDVFQLDLTKEDEKESRYLPALRLALESGPGAELDSARGTMWGAFNAVTFVTDHLLGRQATLAGRSTALADNWFGVRANTKRRAFDLALAA